MCSTAALSAEDGALCRPVGSGPAPRGDGRRRAPLAAPAASFRERPGWGSALSSAEPAISASQSCAGNTFVGLEGIVLNVQRDAKDTSDNIRTKCVSVQFLYVSLQSLAESA